MRIKSLDSLRGVAALIVVFYHLSIIPEQSWAALNHRETVSTTWSWLLASPLSILVAGPNAVLVFFVLSGVVLTLTFVRKDKWHYWPYLVKRVTRLWPPFAIAIIFSATLQLVIGTAMPSYASQWFRASWALIPTLKLVLNHLDLMQIWGGETELDNPVWSLTQEARISLIFPLIAALALFRPRTAAAAGLSCLVGAMLLISGRHRGLVTSASWTILYSALFFAGALIATHIEIIKRLVKPLNSTLLGFAWVVALLLIAYARSNNLYTASGALVFSGACLGSILVVLMSTTENLVTRSLEAPFPAWLGRVSYSLYLIHLPIILAVFHFMPKVSFAINCMVSLSIALAASEIFHRVIEIPSMWAGRRLARILE